MIIRRFTAADADTVLAIECANQPMPWCTLAAAETCHELPWSLEARSMRTPGIYCFAVRSLTAG